MGDSAGHSTTLAKATDEEIAGINADLAKNKKKVKPRRRKKPRSKCKEKPLPSLIQTGESSSLHLNLG